jgi:hypothetical protein
MDRTDFWRSETLAYIDAFTGKSSGPKVCFWGTGLNRTAAKNMYRN